MIRNNPVLLPATQTHPWISPMSESSDKQPDLARLSIERSSSSRGPSGRGWLIAILVAVVAFLGWRLMSPEGNSGEDRADDPGPRTAVARSAVPSASGVSANGYVIARRKAELSTVLSGRLVEIHVEEGTRVTKDQVIARIQYDDYETQLESARKSHAVIEARRAEAEADVAISSSTLTEEKRAVEVSRTRLEAAITESEEAHREVERNRASYEAHDISEQDWDKLQTRARRAEALRRSAQAELLRASAGVETASATLEARRTAVKTYDSELKQANAQIRSAEILLEKTFVRAPFAGIIVEKSAEKGEVVAATGAAGNSKGSVATLVDLETLEVQVELPETRLGAISDGMSVSIFLDVDPQKAWPGAVRQIWPKADRQKGTVELRVLFKDRPPILRPDMGVRAVFDDKKTGKDGSETSHVIVPADAVHNNPTNPHVFLVENGRLRRVGVAIVGDVNGNELRIGSAVEAGAVVVVAPGATLKDGMTWTGDPK